MRAISAQDKKVYFIADQGATWSLYIKLTDSNNNPIDLTNYQIRSHMKKKYSDKNPIAIFQCYIINPLQGTFMLYLDKNITKNISKGNYVMDVEIESNGKVTRILEGSIQVTPEVTVE
ncbi:MAG: hypothetical protein NC901_02840 [Candidatus Omnitrophica bacterium]|nr:hypothetical protein [Candidatus Omnitrophota bacterium]